MWGWWDASNLASLTPDDAIQLTAASSQYLTATSTLGAMDGTDRSFSAWVYLDSVAADLIVLADGNDGVAVAAGTYNFELKFLTATKNFQLKFNGYDGTNETTVTTLANSVTATGTWYLITWTISYVLQAGSIAVQVNGGSGGVGSHTDSLVRTPAVGQVFRIGSGQVVGTYWNGRVDEVGFWTKELSAAELTTLYNGGAGLEYPDLSGSLLTSLSSYYRLREDGATARADSVGALTLTAVNSPVRTTGIPISVPHDGDAVNAWNYLSGNARHLSQATSSKRVIYKTAQQNGLSGLLSDSVDDQYSIANSAIFTDVTVFIVFNQTANAAAKVVFGGAANGSFWVGTDFDEKIALRISAAAGDIAKSSLVAPVGAGMLLTAQYSSGASSAIIRVNGVDDTSFSGAQTLSTANDRMFARGVSANSFNGTVFMILVYTRLLSTTEIVQVENWAQAIYGTP